MPDNSVIVFILGVIILTASLLMHLRKRSMLEAQRRERRKAEAQAAREAERKRQLQMGEPVKIKPAAAIRPNEERIPLQEPYHQTFTGAPAPRNVAKWETEIDQMGRQILGRIDSKMVALQTLTQEANRAANRLELMIEHIEHLVGRQSSPPHLAGTPAPPTPAPPSPIPPAEETRVESFADVLNELESELDQFHTNVENVSRHVTPHDVEAVEASPATIIKAASENVFSNHDNSSTDSSQLEEYSTNQSVNQSTKPMETHRLPSSLSLSTASPLFAEDDFGTNVQYSPSTQTSLHPNPSMAYREPLSTQLPMPPSFRESGNASASYSVKNSQIDSPKNSAAKSIPVKTVTSSESPRRMTATMRPALTPTVESSSGKMAFSSLYEDELQEKRTEAPVAVARPPAGDTAITDGYRLELRKQVEMLADYGYSSRQIAQHLNMTVGEVDLMLSLRN